MTTRIGIKLMAAAAAILVTTAANAHWDKPSCYIEVHDGCFNTQPPCSDEDYNDFLDNCDAAYPDEARAALRLKAPSGEPSAATLASPVYKRKIRQLMLVLF
jgi:hypothetical protein